MREEDLPVILPEDTVTVTKMNHIIEIQHMAKSNHKSNIRKLDKEHYVDLETGEIREFNISENRADNENSLRQTFKKLRYLINNNCTGKANELHAVLTYKENMTDVEQLYKDFKKYILRLKYAYKDKSTVDYISVVEPQGRGAWHCHVLLRFNDLDKIYIPNDEMARLWQQGFVTVRSLKDVDNIGAYLSGYLTDIVLDKESMDQAELRFSDVKDKPIKEVEVNGQSKMAIKGARLSLYPSGMNIYRKSKGMTYPERERIRYKNIKKVVGSATPHYQKTYKVESDDFENTITFMQYNLKRDN